jgi:hypothetical protein
MMLTPRYGVLFWPVCANTLVAPAQVRCVSRAWLKRAKPVRHLSRDCFYSCSPS